MRERERQTLICCFTHLYIHWLILVCALTWEGTHNLGVSGWHSNQMRYLARASMFLFNKRTIFLNKKYHTITKTEKINNSPISSSHHQPLCWSLFIVLTIVFKTGIFFKPVFTCYIVFKGSLNQEWPPSQIQFFFIFRLWYFLWN